MAIGRHGGWGWWDAAAHAANARGDHLLTARIFLFIHLVMQQNWVTPPSTGLPSPDRRYYEDVTAIALDSLFNLHPDLVIHTTAIDRVTVTRAIEWAASVTTSTPPSSLQGSLPMIAAPAPAPGSTAAARAHAAGDHARARAGGDRVCPRRTSLGRGDK